MITPRTRRSFLSDVSRGALGAALGFGLAKDLGLAPAFAAQESPRLAFGELEPLVAAMQETPLERLLPMLLERLDSGVPLQRLVAAAALANARSFGGEDYIGFHTMMALSPAWRMSAQMPAGQAALPVFKVLYRNTSRLHDTKARTHEVLRPVEASTEPVSGERLREIVRGKDVDGAERAFAAIAKRSPAEAFNSLLYEVQDAAEVHRVALPYRAWDLLDVVGEEHAHTMLRQSLRYCLQSESRSRGDWADQPRAILPKLLEQHGLESRAPGERALDDAAVEALSKMFFTSTPAQAAEAAAAALAEGIAPAVVGEAISLAANQLVLRDRGRSPREEVPGKPIGSVHGDSIGVHACDSANAWRQMARVSNARNRFACLILGAWQVAYDRTSRGGDFQNWDAVPVSWHLARVSAKDPEGLLKELDAAIRENMQAQAAAIVHRYGELGHAPEPVFALFLKYAVSEDGALHAEKYYRTVCEEFAALRPAYRWRQLLALARVTASECGRPAPGVAEAKRLLKV